MICTDHQILLFTDLRRNSATTTNCDSRYGKQHFGVSLRFVCFVMFVNCKLYYVRNAPKPSVCPIPIENDSNILSSRWNAILHSTLCDVTRRPIVGNVQSAKMGFVTLLRYHSSIVFISLVLSRGKSPKRSALLGHGLVRRQHSDFCARSAGRRRLLLLLRGLPPVRLLHHVRRTLQSPTRRWHHRPRPPR